MAQEVKKFLDQKGVELLWSKLNMEDYPNNDTLIAVINAIDKNKADKDELHKIATSGNWEDLENRTHYYGYPTITINLDPEKDAFNSETNVYTGGYGSTDPVESQKGIEIGNIFLDQGQWAVLPATLIFDDMVIELTVPRRLPIALSFTDSGFPRVHIHQSDSYVVCSIAYNDNQKHTFTWIAKAPSFKTLSDKFIPHSIARVSNLSNKVDKINGKGLSTNDYTTEEKEKLANISAGAEVNQNAFGQVKIGTTTITADSKTDTLTFVAGNNITLTPDATNDKITITAQATTYSAATTSAAGLMSAADKTKLDGIATEANKTTVDTALSSTSTNPVQNKVVNTALGGKQATITGAATTITDSNLTASKALVSDTNGKVAVSAVTSTELGYLDGVTSAIQTQLNAKASSEHTQAASTITAGTFGGSVVAKDDSQDPNTFLLRNSKLVAIETTPTVNGEICWLYE